jgi:hypothetical protein
LVVHPKTYHQAGLRRGTATSNSTKTGTTSALPPRAVTAGDWQPNGDDRFYRIFEGEERHIGDSIRVWSHGTQHDDGRIEDGATERVFGPPGISVYGVSWENGISSQTAQRLADVLVEARAEVDGWTR